MKAGSRLTAVSSKTGKQHRRPKSGVHADILTMAKIKTPKHWSVKETYTLLALLSFSEIMRKPSKSR